MTSPYIGSVWMFAGNFAPIDFAFCDGSLQAIDQNTALYSVLGTTYGGDGQSTFGLPDLRGRSVIGQGQGPGLSNYVIGEISGFESVTLTSSTMASHTHLLSAGTAATAQAPAGNLYVNQVANGTAAENFFSDQSANATLIAGTIGAAGNSIPIDIIQPVLAISYVIALFGIYPTQ
jgi:microcystin-dependent protein